MTTKLNFSDNAYKLPINGSPSYPVHQNSTFLSSLSFNAPPLPNPSGHSSLRNYEFTYQPASSLSINPLLSISKWTPPQPLNQTLPPHITLPSTWDTMKSIKSMLQETTHRALNPSPLSSRPMYLPEEKFFYSQIQQNLSLNNSIPDFSKSLAISFSDKNNPRSTVHTLFIDTSYLNSTASLSDFLSTQATNLPALQGKITQFSGSANIDENDSSQTIVYENVKMKSGLVTRTLIKSMNVLQNSLAYIGITQLKTLNFDDKIQVLDSIKKSQKARSENIKNWVRDLHSKSIRVGTFDSTCQIGGVNGMNTSFSNALKYGKAISSLANNAKINWVHNHSNGIREDLYEVFFLNFWGYSPITAKLLVKTWTKFHKENFNSPDAKYLHFAYSQGCIHTYNALKQLPEEIRNRIIVVAIAPAKIIPDDLCFRAANYASENDIVPLAELAYNILEFPLGMKDSAERRKQLILLKSHPDASGIDHDFMSPTFQEVMKRYIEVHVQRKGIYKHEEK